MKISIGADHAGFEMKRMLIEVIEKLGHTVHDVGTFDPDKPDDYPDFAAPRSPIPIGTAARPDWVRSAHQAASSG